MLHDYYGDAKTEWPETTLEHLDPSDNLGLTPKKESRYSLSAFGAVVKYLSDAMIDNHVLDQKQIKNIQPPFYQMNL